jgi:hypothetical protein
MANRNGKANYGRVFIIIGAAIVVFILVILFKSPTTPNSNVSDAIAPTKLINQITSVPISVSDTVGSGSSTVKASSLSGKPYLTSNGLPQILYMGAEYCPYCATERWPMIVALSRFGTFKNLSTTHSSTTDVYPNTQTFSFHGSSYTSKYIGFTPVEMYSNIASSSASSGYTTLDTPTSTEQSLMNTYDAPPYVSSSNQGAIPFIYFAGKDLIVGATYSPQVLQGQSYQQIANALSNPKSAIAQGVLGAANNITATICKLTGNKPANVCDSTITKLESGL